jgi:pimeloyl-ACP methyl ester carboxylesterase
MPVQKSLDRYTEIMGIRTRYWNVGGQGPALILIHGLGGFIENWLLNVPALSQRYQVWALDLAGFGLSAKSHLPYSISFFVEFLAEFMQEQGLAHAALIGNSMGGGIALQFSVSYPEMVDALVLVSSAGFGSDVAPALLLAALPLIGEWLTRPNRRRYRRVLRGIFYDPSLVNEEMLRLFARMSSIPGGRRALLATLRSLGRQRGFHGRGQASYLAQWGSITAPSLIVWGRQDRVLPVRHATVAGKVIPNAQVHIFDACGHVPQIEKADEFNSLVLCFLDSVLGR